VTKVDTARIFVRIIWFSFFTTPWSRFKGDVFHGARAVKEYSTALVESLPISGAQSDARC
jgi:hypothetical protein